MVFTISVAGAHQLSPDLVAIMRFPTQLCQHLLAISTLCNQVSQDLQSILAFCIKKYTGFSDTEFRGIFGPCIFYL